MAYNITKTLTLQGKFERLNLRFGKTVFDRKRRKARTIMGKKYRERADVVPLEAKIEAKRHLLNSTAAIKGPMHEEVLTISRELDVYIYQCMLLKSARKHIH
jgi:hypothetical protein